jgi:hypothetical protein
MQWLLSATERTGYLDGLAALFARLRANRLNALRLACRDPASNP